MDGKDIDMDMSIQEKIDMVYARIKELSLDEKIDKIWENVYDVDWRSENPEFKEHHMEYINKTKDLRLKRLALAQELDILLELADNDIIQ